MFLLLKRHGLVLQRDVTAAGGNLICCAAE